MGGNLPPDVIAELARCGITRTRPSARITAARRLEIVRAGTRYLVAQGRSRLAMLAWSDPSRSSRDSTGGEDSLESLFKDELRAAGLAYQSAWVKCELHPNLAGAGWQEFRDIWHSGAGKPDGLLICNDRK